jgi:hypothetical protein
MSNVRYDMDGLNLVASSKQTIATATTTSFDFGTPDDINTASLSGYRPGDRLLVILTASTAGSTSNLTWVIQDAPDSSGSIGSTATAVTSAVAGALAATTGDDFSAFAVQVQPGRPWIRVRATDSGTDSFVCHCSVYSVPNGL